MKKKFKKIRRKSGSKSILYFDSNTHNAIVKFQNNECEKERSEIYINEIFPAFDKLVENLIFIHGFSKPFGEHQSLKCDCVTFLYETLPKFDHTKGSKAFSYFNVVAKNWLIIQSKKRIKSNRRHVSIDDILSLSHGDKVAIETHKTVPAQDSKIIKRESIESLFQLMEKIRERLNNENEISCMEAIITLFKNIEDLDLLNKRAVFVYMRDLSNLNPKQLSVAMSVIRKHYKDLLKTGDFDVFF